MVEMHKILLGTLFTIIIALGIVIFYTDGIIIYHPTDDDDLSVINNTMYTQFTSLNETTTQVASDLETVTGNDASIVDRIGAFFASGYDTLKVVGQSFGILNGMIDMSANQLGVGGSYIKIVRTMLPIAILIIIFVAIILNALIKSDRI